MNKLLSVIFFVAIICSASHSHSGAITDSVFSGATLASLNDITAKSSGGNPVGTIIAWPVAQNPEDMENWLECDGQAVNQTAYPELYSIIGAHVPDLRGQFLRGGTQSQAGNFIPESLKSHNHSYLAASSTGSGSFLTILDNAGDQMFGSMGSPSSNCSNYGGGWCTYIPTGSVTTYTSNTGNTGGSETAPQHMRVRYLIRALP